ncbi:MAG: hypothetical protein R3B06_26990 [Kofleriaceae bacterium]
MRKQSDRNPRHGIVGEPAPELTVPTWFDAAGRPRPPVKLADRPGRPALLFCFQAWCPGCHIRGFPALAQLQRKLGDQADYYVIQTVFEGLAENTVARLLEEQRRYALGIPFGHDPGDRGRLPTTMRDYRTGGTPWFVAIDARGVVVADGFRLTIPDVVARLAPAGPAAPPDVSPTIAPGR